MDVIRRNILRLSGTTLSALPAVLAAEPQRDQAGFVLYPRTAAEGAAAVTPTNYNCPVGDVRRYGADPTGRGDSAAAFLTAQRVASATGIEFQIPAGAYQCTSTLQWGFSGLHVRALGQVTITFTRPGQGICIDGGKAGRGIYGVRVQGYIKVVGNAKTTDAWFIRACHHSELMLHAADCTTGFRIQWCVNTDFTLTCSINENGGTFPVLTPSTGMTLEIRNPGETVAACRFHCPSVEGITRDRGIGIDLQHTFQCTWLGGASEGNKIGVQQMTGDNVGNTFYGMDFEVNATQDVLVTSGSNLTFVNINSVSPCARANVELRGGDNTTFLGGFLRKVDVQNESTGTCLFGCHISGLHGLGITGTGPVKVVGVQAVDGRRVVSRDLPVFDDVGNSGTFMPSISGATIGGIQTYSPDGQVGYYQRVGHMVVFQCYLRLTRNAAGFGAAQLGGLPFKVRNKPNCFANFTITDYTGIMLEAATRCLSLTVAPGATSGSLREIGSGNTQRPLSIGSIGDSATIILCGSYLTD